MRDCKGKNCDVSKYNEYPTHSFLNCIDAFEAVKGDWEVCPKCNLEPKQWVYDNGRSTACGCWISKYDHFSINAESIMSVHKRTDGKKMSEYDPDDLRRNWNHYTETGEKFATIGIRI
ncbi:MAG: hypothetical protein Unbinned7794contig1000_26 [Prokaryotic dsDNA virus sp.]|nr:MAG: hypothetical protein Unbinned7794contig1000_26 [Prokaryotic dsDNA virus sp.]|tara:strand:+ start:7870 stop:8223 length:354 start_codon:yes stop_codon:yes gene_type:complete